jgi:drug/metabolite transporter (DMT)-like permease
MNKQLVAHTMALFTIFVWGTTFIATKILLEIFTPIEILVIRFSIGYLGLNLVSRIEKKPSRKKTTNWRHEILFAAAGVSVIIIYYLLENIALTYTLASNVGIIVSIAPLTTALLASLFLKEESMSIPFLLGLAIALAGVSLIMFNGTVTLKLNPTGDIIALLSTIGWAVYSILLKKIDTDIYSVVEYTKKIFFYGILFMIPTAFILGFDVSAADLTLQSVSLLVFLGIGASAFCFVSWNFAVQILGTLRTSAYIYLTPMVSLGTAAIILSEPITIMAIGGCLLILGGLTLSESDHKVKGLMIQN